MLIDTHCHLDDRRLDADRDAVVARAQKAGVQRIVVPAVDVNNFCAVRDVAHAFDGGAYALGIHPIAVPHAQPADLDALETAIQAALDDPRFVAVGEIGLDFFIPELKTPAMQEKQEAFYDAQLKLAETYNLPVILHVRRSQDRILKYLRRRTSVQGIAHAFNGSFDQAQVFIDLGFALGAGGALTYTRARQIRRLVTELPLEHWVLETDAPDIPPAWLTGTPDTPPRNEPAEVARIAQTLAQLRDVSVEHLQTTTAQTVQRVLPRLFQ